MEVWKEVSGSDGRYQVSNLGKVKSFCQNKTGILMLGTNNGAGYRIVLLTLDNTQKSIRIHRLVAQHFIDNPNNYDVVDHIDGNRSNNHVSNLRWVTFSQNSINSKVPSNNTSNSKGVFFNTQKSRWVASWVEDNKRRTKHFVDKDDAIEFRNNIIDKVYGKEFNTHRMNFTHTTILRRENLFDCNDEEFWKPISFYPKYHISSWGRIKSFNQIKDGIILNGTLMPDGYVSLFIQDFNKNKSYQVHILVATHFTDNPNNYKYVDHIDGNRQNNHISNLRWTTTHQNSLNRKTPSNNTSGVKGVHQNYSGSRFKQWTATWREDGIPCKKSFETMEEAVEYRNLMVDKFYSKEHYKND